MSIDDEQEQWVMPGIRAIKANRLDDGARLLKMAATALVGRGAKSIIMGCTEIPIALAHQTAGVPLVDSTLALAQACVAWAGASPGLRDALPAAKIKLSPPRVKSARSGPAHHSTKKEAL